jgi:hypothetical protein
VGGSCSEFECGRSTQAGAPGEGNGSSGDDVCSVLFCSGLGWFGLVWFGLFLQRRAVSQDEKEDEMRWLPAAS